MGVDLRKEMQQLLDDSGNPVMLIRINNKIRHACWNEQYGAPTSNCKECFGTGYLYQAERHITRSVVMASPPTSLALSSKTTQVGNIVAPQKMFYFMYDALPKIGDLILDCSWDGDKPIIDDYSAVYEINYAQPFRGDQGRIEYFRAACKTDPINMKMKMTQISKQNYVAIDRKS